MSKYPCGCLFKLPRFCEGRKCETCVLNTKNGSKEENEKQEQKKHEQE